MSAPRRQFVRIGSDSPEAGPSAHMENGGNWHHIASKREENSCTGDRFAQIYECPKIGLTFIVSHVHMMILRTGALGGDVRNIEGGWVYRSYDMMRKDITEIAALSRATQ